jgi:PKD repeat protein
MNGTLSILVHTSARLHDTAYVVVHECGRPDLVLSSTSIDANYPTAIELPKQPRLWSPDSPTLYDLVVKSGDDTVKSYVGFRTVSSSEVDGVVRPMLNGDFLVSILLSLASG